MYFFSDSSNVDEYGYLAIGNFTIDSVLFSSHQGVVCKKCF
jgi:hypothetical protein